MYVSGIRTRGRLNSPPAVSKYKTLLARCAQFSKHLWYGEYWFTSEAYVVRSISSLGKRLENLNLPFYFLKGLTVHLIFCRFCSLLLQQIHFQGHLPIYYLWNVIHAISTGDARKNTDVGLVFSFQVFFGWKCFYSCPNKTFWCLYYAVKQSWWQSLSFLLLYQLLTLGSQEHCCCPS